MSTAAAGPYHATIALTSAHLREASPKRCGLQSWSRAARPDRHRHSNCARPLRHQATSSRSTTGSRCHLARQYQHADESHEAQPRLRGEKLLLLAKCIAAQLFEYLLGLEREFGEHEGDRIFLTLPRRRGQLDRYRVRADHTHAQFDGLRLHIDQHRPFALWPQRLLHLHERTRRADVHEPTKHSGDPDLNRCGRHPNTSELRHVSEDSPSRAVRMADENQRDDFKQLASCTRAPTRAIRSDLGRSGIDYFPDAGRDNSMRAGMLMAEPRSMKAQARIWPYGVLTQRFAGARIVRLVFGEGRRRPPGPSGQHRRSVRRGPRVAAPAGE